MALGHLVFFSENGDSNLHRLLLCIGPFTHSVGDVGGVQSEHLAPRHKPSRFIMFRRLARANRPWPRRFRTPGWTSEEARLACLPRPGLCDLLARGYESYG